MFDKPTLRSITKGKQTIQKPQRYDILLNDSINL